MYAFARRAIALTVLGILLGGCAKNFDNAEAANISGVSIRCLPNNIRNQLRLISQRFGSVNVVSAHRPGAIIAGTRHQSYHASCRAVDFHVRGRGAQQRTLRYLEANWKGGIGTYGGCMHHIHIDDGPSIRFHHTVNCNGRRRK